MGRREGGSEREIDVLPTEQHTTINQTAVDSCRGQLWEDLSEVVLYADEIFLSTRWQSKPQ